VSMNADLPPVTAVVLNWNRPQDTLNCLRSLAATAYPALDVIVVDNGSTDDSAATIRTAFPEATVLENERNLGYAAGNNVGIDRALRGGAAFVLVINNDATVEQDAIQELVRAAGRHTGAGALVPKILYAAEPGRIWAAGARWARIPPRVKLVGLNAADAPRFDRPHELAYATGCAWLLSRPALEELGGFDPAYFMYQEDYDFCYRLRAAGYALHYVPSARVRHAVSSGLGSFSPEWWYQWSRSVVRFYRVGNRFPAHWLGLFAAWVLLRELGRGHVAFIPSFLRGVRDGRRALAASGSQG
jgi:GT2 family glycosyltransferase